jgi:hypothetical protein
MPQCYAVASGLSAVANSCSTHPTHLPNKVLSQLIHTFTAHCCTLKHSIKLRDAAELLPQLLQCHLPYVRLQLVLLVEEECGRRLLPAMQEGGGWACCQLLRKLQQRSLLQAELHTASSQDAAKVGE